VREENYRKPLFIDLFAGAGGMDKGIKTEYCASPA
jgi:site-specific DNA-cytosine methylase